MPETAHPKRSELTERLLKRKFGSLFDWSNPGIVKTVGPCEPKVFEDFSASRDELLRVAAKRLSLSSKNDLLTLYADDAEEYPENLSDWDSYLRNEINALDRHEPRWFEGGFGHPDYAADFKYWGQMPHYSVVEALCLSVGVEPNHFGEKTLTGLQNERHTNLYPALRYLVRRLDQFQRKFPPYRCHDQISPRELFAWFDEISLDVHPEFTSQALVAAPSKDAVDDNAANKKPDKRELDSIAQLFTAIAIDGYGYDPTAARSPIPKEIQDIAASLGIEISDDTIRKYLRIGAKFISADWKPN